MLGSSFYYTYLLWTSVSQVRKLKNKTKQIPIFFLSWRPISQQFFLSKNIPENELSILYKPVLGDT